MAINRLVIFGDSLQDNGNLIKTLKIPGKPYDSGRFSNGKVACEYLQQILAEKEGIAMPELINYAVGGAFTTGKNPKSLLRDHSFSVSQQLDRFVADYGRFNADDVIMLNGGSNHFLFALHNEPPYFNILAVYRVASDLITLTNRLIKLGGKKIIVWNIPDVTITPAYGVTNFPHWVVRILKWYVKKSIKQQNNRLVLGIKSLSAKYPKVSICQFDAYHILQNTLNSPADYGFENVTTACVESFGGVDAKGNIQTNIDVLHDPDHHLFWDYVHPTTKAHEMLAAHIGKLLP